ncbi:olfactory receptor 5V1-like [Engystomops pustulosus]|uniref:olfactory receptor 5V1-like n=1 Tax=Engystomops pustulosus TaxID=76066 RepID=UPI003AFA6261
MFNITGFIIEGFADISELYIPLFMIFLLIYFTIISANLTIVVVIWKNPHLHTPMYIFLVNLSFIDISLTTNILPKLLAMLCTGTKTISFLGCITQMYLYVSLFVSEIILLGFMAYDRYVAICHPLRYVVLMPLKKSSMLSIISWFGGFVDPIGHTLLISRMSFCSFHVIDHFFCDIIPLLLLSCTDISKVQLLNYIEGTFLGIGMCLLTVISYIFIIGTIMKLKSSESRRKAFSTCTAHLTCVIVFYGTLICLYIRPSSSYSPKQDKYFSLLNLVFVPLLNPIIYSLKNEDIKKVLIG